jgi:Fic family protein
MHSKANRSLARLDGMLRKRNYANVLLSPMMTQEAVLSSRIEGTRSTIDEVYSLEAGEESTEEQRLDVQEILNYREAMRYATASLENRGLTLGLVKEMHAILLQSGRGQNKRPGLVRNTQNWIGSPGSTIEQASYVPPAPATVDAYLENWIENAATDTVDPLIQSGILHARLSPGCGRCRTGAVSEALEELRKHERSEEPGFIWDVAAQEHLHRHDPPAGSQENRRT